MSIYKKLKNIQGKLSAPKDQKNVFGNYNYRSCEDILSAVKPLLPDGYVVLLTDELILIGERYYIKATATFRDDKEAVSNSALAREQFSKKGMDEAQITGSASSYARKYALNGLFAIDDAKDPDTQKPEVNDQQNADYQKQDDDKPWLNLDQNIEVYQWLEGQIVNGVSSAALIKTTRDKYKVSKGTAKAIESMYK